MPPLLSRRQLAQTLLGATATIQAQQPPSKLTAWMYMIYPLEQWLTNFTQILDAWEAGGVRGIVIGPLRFWDGEPKFDFTYGRSGAIIQTFAPDPAIYKKHGVLPPQNVRLDPANIVVVVLAALLLVYSSRRLSIDN